jgi:ubiquinone biosynthesis protein COQ4
VLNRPPPNYPGHVPLTSLERIGLAVGSAFTSLIDPYRHDMIAACGEATAQPFFITHLKKRMLADPTGRRILRERPRITSKTMPLEKLRQLPENSVGRTYAAWLDREGVTPDTRDQVRYIDDEEEAYVMQRYRECHDFYHALTGLPVFVEGEIGLKAFEFANTGLPMTGLSLAAIIRLKPAERKRMFETYLPWAFSNGFNSKDVINVYWEEELETDVDELRKRLGIEAPPDLREARKRLRDERRRAKEMKETLGNA